MVVDKSLNFIGNFWNDIFISNFYWLLVATKHLHSKESYKLFHTAGIHYNASLEVIVLKDLSEVTESLSQLISLI
jgi:hypothetical protein